MGPLSLIQWGQVGDMGPLSLIQWSLSTRDKLIGDGSFVPYTVEPLYRGQVGDGSFVPYTVEPLYKGHGSFVPYTVEPLSLYTTRDGREVVLFSEVATVTMCPLFRFYLLFLDGSRDIRTF